MKIGYLDDDNLALISEIIDEYAVQNDCIYLELKFDSIKNKKDDLGILEIKNKELDLLILDINLYKVKEPGVHVNGLELAILYKNANPNMDIIFITSHSDYISKYTNEFEIIEKPSSKSKKDEIVSKLEKYNKIYNHRTETLSKFDQLEQSDATKTIIDKIDGNSFNKLTDEKIDELILLVEGLKADGIS